MLGNRLSGREWISGRFARKKASESPGRVAHSAKSWLCHHAVDRSAPFLPWRSDEIPFEKRISPIQASALLLEYLRGAWDARFAPRRSPFSRSGNHHYRSRIIRCGGSAAHPGRRQQARFPDNVRLLEEPQAAFYRWLEQHASPDAFNSPKAGALSRPRHRHRRGNFRFQSL